VDPVDAEEADTNVKGGVHLLLDGQEDADLLLEEVAAAEEEQAVADDLDVRLDVHHQVDDGVVLAAHFAVAHPRHLDPLPLASVAKLLQGVEHLVGGQNLRLHGPQLDQDFGLGFHARLADNRGRVIETFKRGEFVQQEILHIIDDLRPLLHIICNIYYTRLPKVNFRALATRPTIRYYYLELAAHHMD
jgi:hypothetical protein